MDADPSLAAFAVAVDRPDDQIRLAHAALLIAAGDQPELDVDDYLGRLAALAEAAEPARRADDASVVSTASGNTSSRSWASRGIATTTSTRATVTSTRSSIAGSASRSRCPWC